MAGKASFGSSILAVPGEPAVFDLAVDNTASVPDVFSFDVDGEPSRWTTVAPARLQVPAGGRGVARVTCQVPRHPDPPAGAIVLRVAVLSRVARSRPVVAEAVLRIASFINVSADLGPPTSTGWRSGDHTVTLRNQGNAPVVATVKVRRADDDLVVAVQPATLAVPPGSAAMSLVTATCRSRLTRGPEQRRAFALRVEVAGVPHIPLEGEMLQVPRGWLHRAPAGG